MNDPLNNVAILLAAAIKAHGFAQVAQHLSEETLDELAAYFEEQEYNDSIV